jgi:hypothetical protein
MKVLSDILHKAGILKEGAEAYSSGGYSVVVRNATTQRFETVASTAFANIYTSDGSLTANRTVTMGAFTLSFERDIRVNGVSVGKGGGSQSSNIAIGTATLTSNTTGIQNIAIGTNALISNTTASQNIAIGLSALQSNTTGATNIALGTSSLFSNTNGNTNIAIGVLSLFSNTTGIGNTALGFRSGLGTANANTTGSNNIFIGSQSVGVSATESNRTWIGNSSTTSTWLAGNVLIGTTTDAGYKLDVNGEIRGVSRVSASLGGLTNNCLYTYISNHCGSAGYIGFGFVNTTNPALADSVFDIYQGPVSAPIESLFNIKHSLLNASFALPQAILGITTTINQSATATGDIRGIYYNPTVTSVIGNHYAWESTSGKIKVSDLSGTGSRMVVADSSGVLSTSALPTSTNIYNSDGTLTGNRTVTSGGFTLAFQPRTLFGGTTFLTNISVGTGYSAQFQSDIALTSVASKWNVITTDPENFWKVRWDTVFGYSSILGILQTNGLYNGRISGLALKSYLQADVAGVLGAQGLASSSFVSLDGSTNRFLRFWEPGVAKRAVIGHTDSVDGGHLVFKTGDATNLADGTQAVRIFQSSQNVLIGSGITDSGFKLDVQGTARVTGDALINSLTVGRGNSNISSNVVVGETSGTSFTTGNANVAIGHRVLTSITTQVNNIGIGYDALRFATGAKNVGISFESGYNMSGTENVGVGYQTLKVTTGDGNVAVGSMPLRANTSGAWNIAIGYTAMLSNTTGSANTAIGTQAMQSNNGDSNVSIGYQSMYTSTSAQRNIAIGRTSGWDISSADNNVFIGHNTGRGITTGRANSIMGSVQGLTSTLSNNIILADGDGNIRIRAFDTGNVTINSGTDAGFKLDVAGTGRFTNMLSVITTGTTNEVALFKSTEPYITVEAAGGSNSASIFLKPSTSSQNATIQNRTGGGLEFYVNADYVNPKMTIKGTTVNIRSLPTSASGLSSGDLWNDSGTLKVA